MDIYTDVTKELKKREFDDLGEKMKKQKRNKMGKQMKNNNVLHIAIQSGTIKKNREVVFIWQRQKQQM